MSLQTWTANTLWQWSCKRSYRQFVHALAAPREAQASLLRRMIKANANTKFGHAHQFEKIDSVNAFQQNVPTSNAESLATWISRIKQGESNVLTSAKVTHLIPSSGSTAAQKLIPWTTLLGQQFQAAIGPWISDLYKKYPHLKSGRAYWSVTPNVNDQLGIESKVPIGFDDDTAYIGGWKQFLIKSTLATSSSLNQIPEVEQLQMQTLVELLACKDLSLVSVWHPSYWLILLDKANANWDEVIERIEQVNPKRHKKLCQIGRGDWHQVWPLLKLISCWSDGPAKSSANILSKRMPWVTVQPKGLLATEGVMTLPFAGYHPVSLRSHFFEFIDEAGNIHLIEELEIGKKYEIILTTAGGLYRYKIGDQVKVNGFLMNTPSLEFVGKHDLVSDLRGEKLSDGFIAECFLEIFGDSPLRFSLLAPVDDNKIPFYGWYLEYDNLNRQNTLKFAEQLEKLLLKNQNYKWCRELGQLHKVQVFKVDEDAATYFIKRMNQQGIKLGEIKPVHLSCLINWHHYLLGQ